MYKLWRGLSAGLICAAFALGVQAQTWVWVGDGTSNYLTTASNWSPSGTITLGTSTELVFGDSGSYSPTPYLGSGAYQIGTLTITINGQGAIFAGNGTGVISGTINGLNVYTAINFSPSGTSNSTTTNPVQVTGPIYLNGSNVTIGGTASLSSNALELGRAPASAGGGASIITSNGNPITKTGAFELMIGGDASGLGTININGGSVYLDPYALNFQSDVVTATGTTFGIHPGNGATYTYSGVISGSGGFTANSSGTAVLTGANTYTGATLINNGALKAGADNTLPVATALQLNNNATFDVAANQTIDHFNTSSATSSITIESGKTLTVNTSGYTSSTYSGTISGAGGLAVNGTAASGYGASGSELTLNGANTYAGGTTVNGGQLTLKNSSGSALGDGPVTVNGAGNGGALLGGSGSFTGALTLNAGATVVPMPTLGVGPTTFNGGANYYWLVADATGPAGTYWGLLNINGTLAINASSSNPFKVELETFNLSGNSLGLANNFNQTQSYTFKIASATSITGFDASDFTLDTSGFQNTFTGTWSIAQSGNELDLGYTPSAVPEPSTYALLAGLACGGLTLVRRCAQDRRRRRAA